jgi:hypothetical protein
MAEQKPVPASLNGIERQSEIKPSESLDKQALSIIERAALEMADRRPRGASPVPDKTVVSFTPPKPLPPLEPEAPVAQPDPWAELKAAAARSWLNDPPPEEVKPPQTAEPTITAETAKPAKDTEPAEQAATPEDTKPLDDVVWVEAAKPAEPLDTVTLTAADPVAPSPHATITPPTVTSPLAISPSFASPAATNPAIAQPAIEQPAAAPPTTVPPAAAPVAFRPMFDDHFRLSFSLWQSLAITVAIVAFLFGAFGMAATGFVAAHNWSCRTGLLTNYCPPPAVPKTPVSPEIPT